MINFNDYIKQKNSILNRINPTIKIIAFIALLIMTFLPVGFVIQLIFLCFVIILWGISHIAARKMFNILKLMFVLVAIIFLINWLTIKAPLASFDLQNHHLLIGGSWDNIVLHNSMVHKLTTSDGNIHYWMAGEIWGGSVSSFLTNVKPETGQYIQVTFGNENWYLIYQSTWYSLGVQLIPLTISIALRIFFMLTIVSILTNTTPSLQLTYGIEDILHPLRYIKVPVGEIATVISVAIRFVPTLFEEANRITSAQANRGMDIKNGTFAVKVKSVVSLIIPMFFVSFKRAEQLSDAMNARNFDPKRIRTRYKNFNIKVWDWIIFGLIIAICTMLIYFVAWKIIFAPFFVLDCYMG